ncbi:Cyclin-dependent protein kinase inhibitor SMR4, partial [Cucurbita argyrosperma subsp. argyrosperma]
MRDRLRTRNECVTPRNGAFRIPAASKCPPTAEEKAVHWPKQPLPTSGYFHPPDLDALFSMPPSSRWEALCLDGITNKQRHRTLHSLLKWVRDSSVKHSGIQGWQIPEKYCSTLDQWLV